LRKNKTQEPFLKRNRSARPDFAHEQQLIDKGAKLVAGVDEVGRGPLAGPVVAAAVILIPNNLPQGVDDSKRLSPQRRVQLFAEIIKRARAVSVTSLPATDIDHSNIRIATLTAMRRALGALDPSPDFALIDGRDLPTCLPCPAQALIQGDTRSISIASAAIIAKVLRDRMMAQAAQDYPHYGFEKHAGYGTKAHIKAIEQHGGVENWHRFSFAPLKNRRKTDDSSCG